MAKKDEVKEIMEWCEQRKKVRQSIYIIERNPFSMKFDWARSTISIEIDRPLAAAAKTSLVYDSVSKKLYQYINYTWMPISDL